MVRLLEVAPQRQVPPVEKEPLPELASLLQVLVPQELDLCYLALGLIEELAVLQVQVQVRSVQALVPPARVFLRQGSVDLWVPGCLRASQPPALRMVL